MLDYTALYQIAQIAFKVGFTGVFCDTNQMKSVLLKHTSDVHTAR